MKQRAKSFRNKQWKVLAGGMESLLGHYPGGEYWIERKGIDEMRGDLLEWVMHMCQKKWVDVDAFEEAFRVALERYGVDVAPGVVDASFREARKERAESEAWSEAFLKWHRAEHPEQYADGKGPYIINASEFGRFGDMYSDLLKQATDATKS